VATDTHAAIEELLEAVFSVWSMLMLYDTANSMTARVQLQKKFTSCEAQGA
jgi:hypothetical protein